MSNQYNLVADQYDISFQLAPYRLVIEAYSVFELLGDVTGLSVLDLATGTGFYARQLKQRGAARVVGVDIAEQMVQIAQNAEQENPLGISYHVQDVTQFKADEPFDVALAVYLLHYAPSKEALVAMCSAIASNIKSGARFVNYILNPNISREPGYYSEIGLNIRFNDTPSDGEPTPFSATLGGMTTPEVTAYRWDKETVEAALEAAGFRDIRWIQPTLSADGEAQFGTETFRNYLNQPHAVLLDCIKA